MTSDAITGVYSFSYTLGSIISMLWLAINNAWVPWYYKKSKEEKTIEIRDLFRIYNLIFTVITICFILVVPEFVRIMGSRSFRYGIYVTPLIAAASFFMYLYSFPVNYEFYRRKTLYISIGTLCAAIANVGLNFLMIPAWSSMGAAIATLISYILLFLFHYFIATFVIKGFQILLRSLLLPAVIILTSTGLYYLTIDFLIIRWSIAFVLVIASIARLLPFMKKSGFKLPQIK
jgi:hypothetical protein